MSNSYIGPFGRILPVTSLDRPPSPQPTPENPTKRSRASMLASPSQAPPRPRLPLPNRLQFGSDAAPAFSSPQFDGMSSSTWEYSGPRPNSTHEKLPPVSQLLTPASGPISGESSYVRAYVAASPTEFWNGQQSPRNVASGESFLRHESSYFPKNYSGGSASPGKYTTSVQAANRDSNRYVDLLTQNPRATDAYSNPPGGPREPDSSPSDPSMPSGTYFPDQQSPTGARSLLPGPKEQRQEIRTVTKPHPKFLGEQMVPDQGICYVYDDGSHVRKNIDGEAVNAQWGITKAGKPRKRLALACITCREKKIKCEPAEPKCVQCDKSGRECSYKTAVRNHCNDPRSPSYEQQAHTSSAMSEQMDVQDGVTYSAYSEPSINMTSAAPTARKSSTSSSTAMKRVSSFNLKVQAQDPAKKPRLIRGERKSATSSRASHGISAFDSSSSTVMVEALASERLMNPYVVYPEQTLHYINLFFGHFNDGRYPIFPRGNIIRWIKSSQPKKAEELMALYAMLAVGSLYSSREDGKRDGVVFFDIAADAVTTSHGNFTLCLIQSRIFLSYYSFSVGDIPPGQEYFASAIRVAMALRINVEAETAVDHDHDMMWYDLKGPVLTECCRRTFWCAFAIDRYQGFSNMHVFIIQKEDIVLRLPCDDNLYEENNIPSTPYLDNGIIDLGMTRPRPNGTTLSPVAYLIQLLAISGTILNQANRNSQQSPEDYPYIYERFYQSFHKELDACYLNLPARLQYSRENMISSIEGGYSDTFVSLHAVYYVTIILLNSRVRCDRISPRTKYRNVEASIRNAKQVSMILETFLEVSSAMCPRPFLSSPAPSPLELRRLAHHEDKVAVFVPFLGWTAVVASDILSCAGSLCQEHVGNATDRLAATLRILEQLSSHFVVSKAQLKMVRRRRDDLLSLARAPKAGASAWVFRNATELSFMKGALFSTQDASMMMLHILGVEVDDGAVAVL